MTQELLTPDDVAGRLKVSRSTVQEWARTGKIPEIKISPKIRRFDFDAVVTALKGEEAETEALQTAGSGESV